MLQNMKSTRNAAAATRLWVYLREFLYVYRIAKCGYGDDYDIEVYHLLFLLSLVSGFLYASM